ncbi:hypothetical protein [Rhizobium sp. GCM10022189]|uniref:hypothetical protein n=1 Tax=Rhizobium sp. GCM10022189 TaxID=3252654 RepID=UPI003615620B
MIPDNIADMVADIYGRLAELERRNRNRKRTGTVKHVDHEKGLYRVALSEQGGKPYLTGWISPKQLGAGLVKIDILLSEGEQVDVVSETGDLTDAQIDLSSYSEQNVRDNSDVPFKVTIGQTIWSLTEDTATLEARKVKIKGDVDFEGGYLHHEDKDVGHTHKHKDVLKGGDLTGPPA